MSFEAKRVSQRSTINQDRTRIYSQRTSIVEVNLVLNVEVGSPMADLNRTLKLCDLQNRVSEIIVHGDRLLVLGEEVCTRRGIHIVERPVGDSSS